MNAALTISLDLIDLPPRGWPRFRLNAERVEEFTEAYLDGGPAALTPVQVVPQPSGRWLLVNGRHRLAARAAAGATDVLAVPVDPGTQDLVEFAFEYGLRDASRSALPLGRAQKQAALSRILADHPERTDVAIAALVGVSTKTVQRARRTGSEPDPSPRSAPVKPPPSAADVARTLVRDLDRLWDARSLAMTVGIADTSKLGDALAHAFIDRVGSADAVTWTERLSTWATRAHTVALAEATDS